MMRLAYVASTVAVRDALDSAPLDAEELVHWSRTRHLIVLVDEDGPGTDVLRDAGVPVHVSPTRHTLLPDGRWVSADGAQAHLLASLHQDRPLDAIVYGPGAYTDHAWFEPALGMTPRVVCLGGGLVRDLRVVLDAPNLCRRAGRMAASVATFLASADALLGVASPTDHGFATDELPPVFSIDGADRETVEAFSGVPELVAVIATAEDRVGLATLARRVCERVSVGPRSLLAMLVPSLDLGGERSEDLILAGCPPAIREQLIVVPLDGDSTPCHMLRSADAVVAARRADLAVPAVRSSTAPVLVLEPGPPIARQSLETLPPVASEVGERVLVPADGPLADRAAALDDLGEAELAILHTAAGTSEARRLCEAPRLAGVDLVVLGHPDAMYGTPNVGHVMPSVLAAHRSVWPALRRWMPGHDSLWDLIVTCLGPSTLDRIRVLVLPASLEVPTQAVPERPPPDLPFWVGNPPLLPRPSLEHPLVPDDAASTDDVDLRSWAHSHRWHERARLMLPTRFGLLDRSMRDRW